MSPQPLPSFTPEQEARVLDVARGAFSWDDDIRSLELPLRLALEATSDAFWKWHAESDDHGFRDEFSLTPEQVADLSDEWRLAYVARLLRSLAVAYGVDADFGEGELVGEAERWTPAGILRELNEIAHPERQAREMATGAEPVADRMARPDERREAGLRINPETAIVFFIYAQTLDPYGDVPDLPPEEQQTGREFFAVDPEERVAVAWRDLPEETRTALKPKWSAANAEGWRTIFELVRKEKQS